MEARIAPLEPPYEPDVERILERMIGDPGINPLRLFRVVAHNKSILDKFRSTGSYLLNFGTLDPLEREIVIHRTCARCNSEYEWGVHVVVYGRRLGLSEEQIRSTVHGSAKDPVWSRRQAVLIRLADELYQANTISGDLWAELEKIWSPAQLVELVALAGQYRMVSYFTNAFHIAVEEFAESFPEREPE
jgi:4-carboxymuconolactone decarboxylase